MFKRSTTASKSIGSPVSVSVGVAADAGAAVVGAQLAPGQRARGRRRTWQRRVAPLEPSRTRSRALGLHAQRPRGFGRALGAGF